QVRDVRARVSTVPRAVEADDQSLTHAFLSRLARTRHVFGRRGSRRWRHEAPRREWAYDSGRPRRMEARSWLMVGEVGVTTLRIQMNTAWSSGNRLMYVLKPLMPPPWAMFLCPFTTETPQPYPY